MQLASTLLQQAAVRDLVGERVLEGVLDIRVEPGLVDEFAGPEVVESTMQRFVLKSGDRPEQDQKHVLADDRGDLQEALVFRWKPVYRCRQDCLDRGRNLDRLHRLREPIAAALSCQRLRLHQRLNALLQEERIAAPDQKLLERFQAGIVAEERLQ